MEEKYALVIGSSQGLGFEICNYLIEQDYIVLGASRTETEINHMNFIDLAVDVRDEFSVEEMYHAIGETTGHIDLFVNCAGILNMSPIDEMSTNDFADVLNTNVLGAFHLLKHLGDYLIEGETHIIHLSSIASKRGHSNISSYVSSKQALNGLIASCREEWKKLGVRFTSLVPGPINTTLWDKIEMYIPRDEMLSVDDFLHVFDMVVTSPSSIQFPEITFLNNRTQAID